MIWRSRLAFLQMQINEHKFYTSIFSRDVIFSVYWLILSCCIVLVILAKLFQFTDIKSTFIAFLAIIFSFGTGCHSRELEASKMDFDLVVHLVDGKKGDYIISQYANDGRIMVRPASKSENKWTVHYQLSEKKKSSMIRKMEKDKNIISFSEPGEPGPPTNSTNSGHSKTKPIKNQ